MSSTFGTLLKVVTFGESHGKGVGAVLDGCPSKIDLSEADIQRQLDRRRPGQSKLTTKREEPDRVTILSGVENGKTLGVPIALLVANKDQKPGDYNAMQFIPRPSHADYTYQMKYGIRSASGGGRSSARETVGRVAAGAIADGQTAMRARAKGLDPPDYLHRNDSYTFFKALDDLLITGPTRTNVMDVRIMLIGKSQN